MKSLTSLTAKISEFFSRKTNSLTRTAIVLLILVFFTGAPIKVYTPEKIINAIAIYDLRETMRLLALFISWVLVAAAVWLSIAGRRNLGFLIAIVAFTLNGINVLILSEVLGLVGLLGFVFAFFGVFSAANLSELISSIALLPIALFFLILGRPEVQKKFKNWQELRK